MNKKKDKRKVKNAHYARDFWVKVWIVKANRQTVPNFQSLFDYVFSI